MTRAIIAAAKNLRVFLGIQTKKAGQIHGTARPFLQA
jgi:hypothetical protein